MDVAALRRGRVQGGELCEVAGVGPIPVSGAKELLGEAIVKLIITDGVDVLNVTHLGRGPTAAQRAALLWMNPSCSVDGCHRTRFEWDHREPWAQTHTRLDELDPLCSFHHDLKTRFGWALVPARANEPSSHPTTPDIPATANPQVSSHVPTPQRPGRRRGQQPRRRHPAKPAHPDHLPGRRGPDDPARPTDSVRRQRGVEVDADTVGIADGGIPLAPRCVERGDVGAGAEGGQFSVQPIDVGWRGTAHGEREPSGVRAGPRVLGERLHHCLAVDHQPDATEITLEVFVEGARVGIGQCAASGSIESDSTREFGRDESDGVDHGHVIHAVTVGPHADSWGANRAE